MTRGAELQRIAREGKRIRTINLDVRATASPRVCSQSWPSPISPSAPIVGMRVGFVVPKYKHTAVARNQLKRRLKELARLRLLPSGLPGDVVIRVRPEAYSASFDALTADVSRAIAQLARWHADLDPHGGAL